MGNVQFKIVWITGAIIALELLILPWEYTFQAQGISQVRKPAGYSVIFDPPAPERDNPRFGVEVDFGRLSTEILSTLVIGGLALLTFHKKFGVINAKQ